MPRLLVLSVTAFLGASLLLQAAEPARSDKAILADLKKILAALEKDKENLEGDKLAAQIKKHAEKAQQLLQEFEKAYPKSPLLPEVRSLALTVLDESTEEAMVDRA